MISFKPSESAHAHLVYPAGFRTVFTYIRPIAYEALPAVAECAQGWRKAGFTRPSPSVPVVGEGLA